MSQNMMQQQILKLQEENEKLRKDHEKAIAQLAESHNVQMNDLSSKVIIF